MDRLEQVLKATVFFSGFLFNFVQFIHVLLLNYQFTNLGKTHLSQSIAKEISSRFYQVFNE